MYFCLYFSGFEKVVLERNDSRWVVKWEFIWLHSFLYSRRDFVVVLILMVILLYFSEFGVMYKINFVNRK